MAEKKTVGIRGAAVIQLASKYANILIQLIITAVLARLIDPAAFGEVSIVTVFTGFFALFADMGLGTAVVQFRDLRKQDFEKLFTFSLLLALALGGVFCAISPAIALFYNDHGLLPLLFASAPALVFNALNMVPNGLMLREKRFKQIGLRLIVSSVVTGAIACLAAYAGIGAYALILQNVLSAFMVVCWNLICSPIRRLDVHFMGPLRKVFSYSSFQFGFNTVNYFSRNLDNLLIGKVFGDASLGYYDKAYKLTTYPLSAFTGVIASVVQPFMAEHQDHPEVIWDFWFKITKAISLVAAFVCAVFVTCSSEIVLVVYGSQWEASIPLFSVLALSVYTQMIGNTAGGFFQSLGRTDLMFKCSVMNTALTIALLVAGLVAGDLFVVACMISLAYLVTLWNTMRLLIGHAFERSMKVLFRLLPEICIGAAASLCAFFISQLLPGGVLVPLVVKMAVIFAVMLAGYAATHQLSYLKAVLGRR